MPHIPIGYSGYIKSQTILSKLPCCYDTNTTPETVLWNFNVFSVQKYYFPPAII